MAAEDRPNLGSTQPKTGIAAQLTFQTMGRRSKKHRLPARIQGDIADAVNSLIARSKELAALANRTAVNQRLADLSDTSKSNIERATTGSSAIGVDTLERLARALGTTPAYLVTPYATATVNAPPPVLTPTPPSALPEPETKDELQRPRNSRHTGGGSDT
jgi:transcriptional regulator with XRE-family HTH domain